MRKSKPRKRRVMPQRFLKDMTPEQVAQHEAHEDKMMRYDEGWRARENREPLAQDWHPDKIHGWRDRGPCGKEDIGPDPSIEETLARLGMRLVPEEESPDDTEGHHDNDD